MRILVQGYFVYERTHDPFQTALVQFFSGLPVLLLSPLAGVAADRFDRRKLLAVIQVANAVPAFGVAILSALGRLEVWHVYLMAFCIGASSAFDWPARLSLVPNLVPREQLQSAVALNSASFNFSRIIGPAIGGVLIGPLGVTGCFFIAACCYVPFILTLLTVLARVDLAPPTGGEHHPFATLRAGYAYIWSHETLRSLLTIDLIPVMLGMTYFGLLPALAGGVLHRGSGGLGALQASAGLGALIGVLIVAMLTGVRGRGRIVLGGMTGFGLALLCFGLSHNFYLSCAILFVAGDARRPLRLDERHARPDGDGGRLSRPGDGRLQHDLGPHPDRQFRGRHARPLLRRADGARHQRRPRRLLRPAPLALPSPRPPP